MNQNRLSGRPDLQKRVTGIIAQLQPRVREVERSNFEAPTVERGSSDAVDVPSLRSSRGDRRGDRSNASRGISRPTREVVGD